MSKESTGVLKDALSATDRRALHWELFVVLMLTFGMSGVRAALRLAESLANPEPLNQQTTTLNSHQSALPWLDPVFQTLSSGALFMWGGLALFLLWRHLPPRSLAAAAGSGRGSGNSSDNNPAGASLTLTFRWRDAVHGVGLASIIGIPGLAFYIGAVHFGLSKNVVPSGLGGDPWQLPLLILDAWANGFAEELVVIAWLATRMRQLGAKWPYVFAASAILRGSYHLYQGVSAGAGNIVMGLIYMYYFKRTGRVWPLVIGHALIDTVAFVGFALGVRV